MSENVINKIKVGNVEYDIEASSIGEIDNLAITNPEESNIEFSVPVTGSDTKSGVIGLNSKGNLSVESLSKHVNLEAKQAIQLKPTTSIIVDTSRKVHLNKDNEAEVNIKYDDYDKDRNEGQSYADDDDRFGYLKLNARAIDLRCNEHGGIAAQSCGIDGNGNENKIKFESSRKVSANDTIPSDLRRNSPSYGSYYAAEGGKGVEFGTFNNEHTSLFTKDYRFNQDGKVFSVTRKPIVTTANKSDYPTQGDDFKDVPMTTKDNECVFNSNNKKWEISNPAVGEYEMSATWKSIVKTANALNDVAWSDTNISGKDNLQITTIDEYNWSAVEAPGSEVPADHILTVNTETPKYKYYADGGIYKLSDGSYATCSRNSHHLNLEADSTIKLEAKHDDLELLGGGKVQVESKVIKIEANNIDGKGVNSGVVDFSTTPNISFMAKKINKQGKFEEIDAMLNITSLNNLSKTIYENTTDDYVRITNDTLYTAPDVQYVPQLVINKVEVYKDSLATERPVKDDVYFIKNGVTFLVEINNDNEPKAKKNPKICDNGHTVLYTNDGTVFQPLTNTNTGISLYTDVEHQNTATTGYYLVEENDSTYIIYIDSNNERANFVYDKNTTDPDNPTDLTTAVILADSYITTGYNKIVFGGPDSAQTDENPVTSGSPLEFGSTNCSISDIVTLINYFKNGAGKQNGPWHD